jgi:hypothetical protein
MHPKIFIKPTKFNTPRCHYGTKLMLEDLFVRQFISSVPYVYNQYFFDNEISHFCNHIFLVDVLGWACCSFSCDGYVHDMFDSQDMYVLFTIKIHTCYLLSITPPPYGHLLTLLQGCHQQSVAEKYYDRVANAFSY